MATNVMTLRMICKILIFVNKINLVQELKEDGDQQPLVYNLDKLVKWSEKIAETI